MNQNTIKVLLADDNKDFCDIIVDHLNKQEDITVVAVAMASPRTIPISSAAFAI